MLELAGYVIFLVDGYEGCGMCWVVSVFFLDCNLGSCLVVLCLIDEFEVYVLECNVMFGVIVCN